MSLKLSKRAETLEANIASTTTTVPPGPMTGSSTIFAGSTYTASSTSDFSTSYPAWKSFERTVNGWQSYYKYSGGSPNTGTASITLSDASVVKGERLQLDLPMPMQFVGYNLMEPHWPDRMPATWTIIGLNSATGQWDKLHSYNITSRALSGWNPNQYGTWQSKGAFTVNASGTASTYSSLAIIVQSMGNSNYGYPSYCCIPDMNYVVLVPGPVALTSLRSLSTATPFHFKWPPAPLTDYVTTITDKDYGRGTYNVYYTSRAYGGNPYPWKAFDWQIQQETSGEQHQWTSEFPAGYNRYDINTGVWTAGTSFPVALSDGTTIYGERLELAIPTNIHLVKYAICAPDYYRCPATWVLIGNNSDTRQWDRLHEVTDSSALGSSNDLVEFLINSNGTTSKYCKFGIVVTKVGSGGNNYRNAVVIHEMCYYGFEGASAPIRMSNLVKKYPTAALTASSTALTDGTYTASASFEYSHAYKAFNSKWYDQNQGWSCQDDADTMYSATTGQYIGSTQTMVDGTAQPGEWLQLVLPVAIMLKSYSLSPVLDFTTMRYQSRMPSVWIVAGSTDGVTWATVDARATVDWISNDARIFMTTNASTAYKYYRLIVQQAGNASSTANRNGVDIAEWQLFA